MSSQQPGAPRPGSQPGVDAAAPVPVTAPSAAGQPTPSDVPGWGRTPPRDAHLAPEAAPGWGTPPAAPGWGAPAGTSGQASDDKPWTLKRGLLVGGVVAALAVGAGTGVYALTSSSASADGAAAGFAGSHRLGSQGSQGSGQGMPGAPQDGQAGGGMPGQGGRDGFAAGGMGGMGGGLSAALHAEYVTLQGSTYTAMAEQLGTVGEVSPTSVTVKSSDGFTRTYALDNDVVVSNVQQRRQQPSGTGTQPGVADIVAGGTVGVVATKEGSGYNATAVMIVAASDTGQAS
jgi:hypothetical protein